MIKLDRISPSLTLPPASSLDALTSLTADPKPARRLMVLIPAVEADYTPAIHRVWELARTLESDVILLGLCNDAIQEPMLRRALATMSALMQDARVSVEVKVETETDWVDAVRRNNRTDDMIVCFAEQRAGLLRKPLSQILESNLKVPIYILSGLHLQKTESGWFTQAITWLGSIGIILGFGILQVKIVQIPDDWFQNLLLILSIIPEFWLIWVWNSLFS